MKYIIDAYNLIGKLSSICLSHADKEDKLVSFLEKLPSKKHDSFMCVFDGKCKYSNHMSVYSRYRVKSVFTDPEQCADSYIVNYCMRKNNKTGFIVVSSDNEILSTLKKARVKTLSCSEFLNYFNSYKQNHCDEKNVYLDDTDFWLNQFNSD